jgi:hypothetical protein
MVAIDLKVKGECALEYSMLLSMSRESIHINVFLSRMATISNFEFRKAESENKDSVPGHQATSRQESNFEFRKADWGNQKTDS